MAEIILGGSGGKALAMDAAMANRHGIISGATGSGKTLTLQLLAEGFSPLNRQPDRKTTDSRTYGFSAEKEGSDPSYQSGGYLAEQTGLFSPDM